MSKLDLDCYWDSLATVASKHVRNGCDWIGIPDSYLSKLDIWGMFWSKCLLFSFKSGAVEKQTDRNTATGGIVTAFGIIGP
jgi:hypothetical protein